MRWHARPNACLTQSTPFPTVGVVNMIELSKQALWHSATTHIVMAQARAWAAPGIAAAAGTSNAIAMQGKSEKQGKRPVGLIRNHHCNKVNSKES